MGHFDEKDIDTINFWAVINPGTHNKKIQSLCLRKKLQFVSFCKEESGKLSLKIVIERMPATIHQVNKVLDLMIDKDEGCWIFSADDMVFKMEDFFGKHHVI